MLHQEPRLYIATVQVPFKSLTVSPDRVSAELLFKLPKDSLEAKSLDFVSRSKFEKIPIMVTIESPAEPTLQKEIIVFEGLAQLTCSYNKDIQLLICNMVALPLTIDILTNIKYKELNIGRSFGTLNTAVEAVTDKNNTLKTGKEKLISTAPTPVTSLNSYVFTQKLITGQSAEAVKTPMDIFYFAMGNLTTNIASEAVTKTFPIFDSNIAYPDRNLNAYCENYYSETSLQQVDEGLTFESHLKQYALLGDKFFIYNLVTEYLAKGADIISEISSSGKTSDALTAQTLNFFKEKKLALISQKYINRVYFSRNDKANISRDILSYFTSAPSSYWGNIVNEYYNYALNLNGLISENKMLCPFTDFIYQAASDFIYSYLSLFTCIGNDEIKRNLLEVVSLVYSGKDDFLLSIFKTSDPIDKNYPDQVISQDLKLYINSQLFDISNYIDVLLDNFFSNASVYSNLSGKPFSWLPEFNDFEFFKNNGFFTTKVPQLVKKNLILDFISYIIPKAETILEGLTSFLSLRLDIKTVDITSETSYENLNLPQRISAFISFLQANIAKVKSKKNNISQEAPEYDAKLFDIIAATDIYNNRIFDRIVSLDIFDKMLHLDDGSFSIYPTFKLKNYAAFEQIVHNISTYKNTLSIFDILLNIYNVMGLEIKLPFNKPLVKQDAKITRINNSKLDLSVLSLAECLMLPNLPFWAPPKCNVFYIDENRSIAEEYSQNNNIDKIIIKYTEPLPNTDPDNIPAAYYIYDILNPQAGLTRLPAELDSLSYNYDTSQEGFTTKAYRNDYLYGLRDTIMLDITPQVAKVLRLLGTEHEASTELHYLKYTSSTPVIDSTLLKEIDSLGVLSELTEKPLSINIIFWESVASSLSGKDIKDNAVIDFSEFRTNNSKNTIKHLWLYSDWEEPIFYTAVTGNSKMSEKDILVFVFDLAEQYFIKFNSANPAVPIFISNKNSFQEWERAFASEKEIAAPFVSFISVYSNLKASIYTTSPTSAELLINYSSWEALASSKAAKNNYNITVLDKSPNVLAGHVLRKAKKLVSSLLTGTGTYTKERYEAFFSLCKSYFGFTSNVIPNFIKALNKNEQEKAYTPTANITYLEKISQGAHTILFDRVKVPYTDPEPGYISEGNNTSTALYINKDDAFKYDHFLKFKKYFNSVYSNAIAAWGALSSFKLLKKTLDNCFAILPPEEFSKLCSVFISHPEVLSNLIFAEIEPSESGETLSCTFIESLEDLGTNNTLGAFSNYLSFFIDNQYKNPATLTLSNLIPLGEDGPCSPGITKTSYNIGGKAAPLSLSDLKRVLDNNIFEFICSGDFKINKERILSLTGEQEGASYSTYYSGQIYLVVEQLDSTPPNFPALYSLPNLMLRKLTKGVFNSATGAVTSGEYMAFGEETSVHPEDIRDYKDLMIYLSSNVFKTSFIPAYIYWGKDAIKNSLVLYNFLDGSIVFPDYAFVGEYSAKSLSNNKSAPEANASIKSFLYNATSQYFVLKLLPLDTLGGGFCTKLNTVFKEGFINSFNYEFSKLNYSTTKSVGDFRVAAVNYFLDYLTSENNRAQLLISNTKDMLSLEVNSNKEYLANNVRTFTTKTRLFNTKNNKYIIPTRYGNARITKDNKYEEATISQVRHGGADSYRLHCGVDFSPIDDNTPDQIDYIYAPVKGRIQFMVEKNYIANSSPEVGAKGLTGFGLFCIFCPETPTEKYETSFTALFAHLSLSGILSTSGVKSFAASLQEELPEEYALLKTCPDWILNANYTPNTLNSENWWEAPYESLAHRKDAKISVVLEKYSEALDMFVKALSLGGSLYGITYDVLPGEVIGAVGCSGSSFGTHNFGKHLHVTCRIVTSEHYSSLLNSSTLLPAYNYLTACFSQKNKARLTFTDLSQCSTAFKNLVDLGYRNIQDILGVSEFEKNYFSASGLYTQKEDALSTTKYIHSNLIAKSNRRPAKELTELIASDRAYTEIISSLCSVPPITITLPYVDPYVLTSGFPAAVVYRDDIVLAKLENSYATLGNSNSMTLQFNKGLSVKKLLYYFFNLLINTKNTSITADIKNSAFFPLHAVDFFNNTFLNIDYMSFEYERMFGKTNFVFDWKKAVYLNYNNSYISFYEILNQPNLKAAIISGDAKVDYQNIRIDLAAIFPTFKPQGAYTYLLEERAWEESRLYTKDRNTNFISGNQTKAVSNLTSGNLGTYENFSIALMGKINNNNLLHRPALFYDWKNIFKGLTSSIH